MAKPQPRRRRKSRQEIADELEKIQTEVDQYFDTSKDATDPPVSTTDPNSIDLDKLTPKERKKLLQEMPVPVKIAGAWQDFVVKSGENVKQMQEEMHANYLKRMDRLRAQKNIRQHRRLERIKRREVRVETRYQRKLQEFEDANDKLNENMISMKQSLYEKKAENRDRFHQNFNQSQERRDRMSIKRQRNWEGLMKGISRWGWRQQLKIVLIIIPLIIVFIIVFLLVRPLLTV
ncbi:MAG: hypothetical protein ACTSYI_17340 [Promethearchaeota archaeon]